MTADLAIIAMAAVTLAQMAFDHRHRMKIADRERLVGPAKQPVERKREDEAKTEGAAARPPALVPGIEDAA